MLAALFLLQTALTLGTPGPAGSPEYLAVHVAHAEGHFAAEGLQVSLRALAGEGGAAKALGDGRVDLAATSLDEALRQGHTRGAPPRLVFGLSHVAPVALLAPAAPQPGSVRAVGDLAGKTVGIPAPGSPEHGLVLSLLARARVPVHRVPLQSMGSVGLARAIASGAVAAGMIGEPWATDLVRGGAAVLADFREPGAAAALLGEEPVYAALFAPAQSGLGNPELAAVDRALLRALERLRSAPAEDLATRLGAGVAGRADEWPARLAAARAVLVRDGWVTVDALEFGLRLMRERAPIPVRVLVPRRLADLIASEPLRQALGRPR